MQRGHTIFFINSFIYVRNPLCLNSVQRYCFSLLHSFKITGNTYSFKQKHEYVSITLHHDSTRTLLEYKEMKVPYALPVGHHDGGKGFPLPSNPRLDGG